MDATRTPAQRSTLSQAPNRPFAGYHFEPAGDRLLPLDGLGSSAFLTPHRLERLALAFVILGLVARCVRFFLRFPLWEDESFLCYNLLSRDYLGLNRPLDYHQVAPVLYLWMQLSIVKLLGFGEMSLRLVSFLSGIGSLLLFWQLARRCLVGLPQLLAVALFSVSYGMVRYSAEAKPYGLDLFLALVLIMLAVRWLDEPGRSRPLWLLAAIIPVAVGLSYGTVFIGGGLSATVAWTIWRGRRWGSVVPWAVYSAALLAGFGAQFFLCMETQQESLERMREMWHEWFPPIHSLGQFTYWMLLAHSGDIVAYPAGGSPFQSTLSAICWVAGLIALARRRQGSFLILCLAPQVLLFVAALLRRYPYGGHIRLSLFLAPLMCMVIGYGTAALIARLTRKGWREDRLVHGFLGALAVVALGCMVRDLATPFKSKSDLRARGFAQWFWYNAEQDGEVVCLNNDLGVVFSPAISTELNFSAQFFCNERIYSPRHAAGEPVRWGALSASHPLRCVLYRPNGLPFDDNALQAWLREMRPRFDLVGRRDFPMVRQWKEGDILGVDHVEVFEFLPRVKDSPRNAARGRAGAPDGHGAAGS